jgi:hypothetical protein
MRNLVVKQANTSYLLRLAIVAGFIGMAVLYPLGLRSATQFA